MGMFDFVKDAGEKLRGRDHETKEEANREKAQALSQHVKALGLNVKDLKIDYYDETATLTGLAASREEKEKVVLTVGNTQGVAKVNDMLRVAKPQAKVAEAAPEASAPAMESEAQNSADEPETKFYTVQPGDSLSKIAKEQYGNGMKYRAIFEANKPMLSDPNKIYPGQVLRIPPPA